MTDTERDTRLILLLDKGFLDKLMEIAKLVGWSIGDYTEVANFVHFLYDEIDLKKPDMEPYEIDYED